MALPTCSLKENVLSSLVTSSSPLINLRILDTIQGVTKRCSLSLLTNSALVCESKCGGTGGSYGDSANEYSYANHVTWSPNKLWISTSVFNLWYYRSDYMQRIIAGIRDNVEEFKILPMVQFSVADPDPDPGSGAFLTPGSGIRNRFFPDPGSRIPNPYIWGHIENFMGIFNHSLKIGPNFFLKHFKNDIIFNFEKFVTTKKVW